MKKLLLLGHTGKVGIALMEVFKKDYEVIGKNSGDFDAKDLDETKNIIEQIKPDIVINTIAFLGIDNCEENSEIALGLNTLYPKLLAELSNKLNFLLIHFSTDAVFDGKKDSYIESDNPKPINMYGLTKYGGDCFIESIAKRYYILRPSLIFGKSKSNQFVEKMLQKIKDGEFVNVSNDIVTSFSYSKDIAEETKRIIEESLPFGLYHIANEGKATLYDLISEIKPNQVEKASYKDFSYVGKKNINTYLISEKIDSLRNWKEAVKDYTKDGEW